MKVRFKSTFTIKLSKQIKYISKDSPNRAKVFSSELLLSIEQLKSFPYSNRKSIYFDDNEIRDLIYKGYTITYYINTKDNYLDVFGFTKYLNSID